MNARDAAGARARAIAGLAVVALAAALLVGCGGDGDAADGSTGTGDGSAATETTTTLPPPTGPIDAEDLFAATGEAPAARGAGLDEPPGEPGRVPLEGFGETAAALVGPDGTVTPWCLLLALAQEQRSRGLMEVTDLRGYPGMLFAWNEDTTSSFYMRNTPMPLSIAWFDAEGEFVSSADMEPCENADGCPLYSATGPYRFAVEVPQGELDRLGVGEGTRLRVGGPCVERSSA